MATIKETFTHVQWASTTCKIILSLVIWIRYALFGSIVSQDTWALFLSVPLTHLKALSKSADAQGCSFPVLQMSTLSFLMFLRWCASIFTPGNAATLPWEPRLSVS